MMLFILYKYNNSFISLESARGIEKRGFWLIYNRKSVESNRKEAINKQKKRIIKTEKK